MQIQPPSAKSTKKDPEIVFGYRNASTQSAYSVKIHKLLTSCEVLGASGTGKTSFLQHLATSLIGLDFGLCLIDPHGGLYDSILEYIIACKDKNMAQRLILLDFSDPNFTFSWNPFATQNNETGQVYYKTQQLIDALLSGYDNTDLDTQKRLSKWLTLAFYALYEQGLTLLDAYSLLRAQHSKDRNIIIKGIKNPMVKAEFEQLKAITREEMLTHHLESSMNALAPFFLNDVFREMFAQPDASLDFKALIEEKKIVLCCLSPRNNRLDPRTSKKLGAILINQFTSAARNRRAEKAFPYFLMIDEASRFLTLDNANALDELRKYGLPQILSYHYDKQLEARDPLIYQAVRSQAGVKVFFRIPRDEDRNTIALDVLRNDLPVDIIKTESIRIDVITKYTQKPVASLEITQSFDQTESTQHIHTQGQRHQKTQDQSQSWSQQQDSGLEQRQEFSKARSFQRSHERHQQQLSSSGRQLRHLQQHSDGKQQESSKLTEKGHQQQNRQETGQESGFSQHAKKSRALTQEHKNNQQTVRSEGSQHNQQNSQSSSMIMPAFADKQQQLANGSASEQGFSKREENQWIDSSSEGQSNSQESGQTQNRSHIQKRFSALTQHDKQANSSKQALMQQFMQSAESINTTGVDFSQGIRQTFQKVLQQEEKSAQLHSSRTSTTHQQRQSRSETQTSEQQYHVQQGTGTDERLSFKLHIKEELINEPYYLKTPEITYRSESEILRILNKLLGTLQQSTAVLKVQGEHFSPIITPNVAQAFDSTTPLSDEKLETLKHTFKHWLTQHCPNYYASEELRAKIQEQHNLKQTKKPKPPLGPNSSFG